MTPPVHEPASNTLPALEMVHVLFMDIVSYSKLQMEQQHKLLGRLQETVQGTAAFARGLRKQKLICLPTGDGMALVFFGDPEAPVRCAVELSQALRGQPDIKLRMGIHTGPVFRVADINANLNVAGGGINYAQRVMDCGDEGHILVSKVVADTLAQLGNWGQHLQDLGEVEVKHGVRIHIYNLHTGEAGNPHLPQKLQKGTSAGPISATSQPARSLLDATVVESVGKELAAFVGPIAKLVVKRAAERCSSVDELYGTVAVEIGCEKDRSSFLAGKKRRV